MLDIHTLTNYTDNLLRDVWKDNIPTRDLIMGTAALLSDVFEYVSAMRKEMDAMKEEIITLRSSVEVAAPPQSTH